MEKTYSINGIEYTIADTASGNYTVTVSTSAFEEPNTYFFKTIVEAYEFVLNDYACEFEE